jgi:hypothetical protein
VRLKGGLLVTRPPGQKAQFAFGGMPHHEAELNMRLFADRAMPALQHDLAFAHPSSSAPGDAPPAGQCSDGFALT